MTAPNAVPGGRATRRRLRAGTAASAVACTLLLPVGRPVPTVWPSPGRYGS